MKEGRMRFVRTGAVALVALLGWAGLASAADDPPSYSQVIKPFLAKYCLDCHNNAKAKSGYSVETFDRLTRAGRRGALVVPERPDDSLLLLTMTGKGKQMPPRRAAQPKAEEVAKVRGWIKAGAKDDMPADDRKAGDAKP
jgi:hypothetical protein